MKRSLLIPLLGILFFPGGCTMIPEYERPEAPVPDTWPSGPAYQEKSAKGRKVPLAADIGWKNFFTDKRLKKIIKIALENNRDLRVAALNVKEAKSLYGIQRAELLPGLYAVGAGGETHLPADIAGTPDDITREEDSLTLGIPSWEIDLFGHIRSLGEKALEKYLASKEGQRSVQISLVSAVARAYLALAADQEHLKLAKSILKTRQEDYNLIQSRYSYGVATELDLRRSQIRVDSARRDVARYRQVVAQDKNALDLLAGSSVPKELLPSDLSSVAPFKEITAGLSSEILLRRPDILASEHRLKAANANIGAARAAFFPRITLTAGVGTASTELSGLFESGSGAWSYAPQISIPIFDPRIWPALKVSKVQKKRYISQYEKAIQTAFKEVADALAVQGTVDDQLSAQKSLVQATDDTLLLANKSYQYGVESYLSVLDAQRSLDLARQELVSIRLAKLSNKVNLYAVLGGGVD